MDNLNAIAYIGRARLGTFGQSKSIGDPMGPVNVTTVAEYKRVINFSKPENVTALVSRATGTTHPPMCRASLCRRPEHSTKPSLPRKLPPVGRRR